MIERPVTDALVAFILAQRPPGLAAFEVRPYDADETLNGPPVIVVQVKSAKARVRGTNLFDADIVVTLRVNPHDTTGAGYEAAWDWLSRLLYPAAAAVAALTNAALHCYTLQSDPSDSDVTLDENERSRAITLIGVFVAKTLS